MELLIKAQAYYVFYKYKHIDMKKMIFMMLLTAYFNAYGQEVYKTLLVEGKEWTCQYVNYNAGIDSEFKLFIAGDTLIGGQEYMKVYKNDKTDYQYALREDNHKIFIAYNGTAPRLLYDFSKGKGEPPLPDYPDLKVENIDTIKAGDYLFRRFHLISSSEYGRDESWWVEGVGSCFGLEFPLQSTGASVRFLSSSVGGITIITREQFFAHPIVTSIDDWPQEMHEATTKAYDLQGRRLNTPKHRGLYIRDGRKVVVR